MEMVTRVLLVNWDFWVREPAKFYAAYGQVYNILKAATHFEEHQCLLEKRETAMRLPPLLLTIALSKYQSSVFRHTEVSTSDMDHIAIVKLLIKYGAIQDSTDMEKLYVTMASIILPQMTL
eukprot:2449558-Ditylum_brightwellii.AAC.1